MFVPALGLPDERGFRRNVPPVGTCQDGDELALGEALESALRRSGRRQPAHRTTEEDPGPVGRAAGCRTESGFLTGLRWVTVEFSDTGFSIYPWRLVRHRPPFAFEAGEAEDHEHPTGVLDFIALARALIARLQQCPPIP